MEVFYNWAELSEKCKFNGQFVDSLLFLQMYHREKKQATYSHFINNRIKTNVEVLFNESYDYLDVSSFVIWQERCTASQLYQRFKVFDIRRKITLECKKHLLAHSCHIEQ